MPPPLLPIFSDHRNPPPSHMRTLEMRGIKWAVRAELRTLGVFLELPKLLCLPLEGQSYHTWPRVQDLGFHTASQSASFFIVGLLVWRWPPPPFLLAYLFRDVTWGWGPCDRLPAMSNGGRIAFQDAKYKHMSKVSTVSIAAAAVAHK